MEKEPREKRLRNLKNLGKFLNAWHFVYAIIFITFFPYLTKDTAIHEHVVSISRYGTIGILLTPVYLRLVKLLLERCIKTGRNLESLTLVPMMLLGALIGTSISYIMLRIFKHEGDWGSTLSISYEDAIIALFINFIFVTFGGLSILVILYYREGQNVIMRDGKPTPFWLVLVLLFFLPFLLLFAILVRQILE